MIYEEKKSDNMIEEIRKINVKLYNEFLEYNINQNFEATSFKEGYYDPIINFINKEIDEIEIKQFDYLDEINTWLTSIQDLKNYIHFCEEEYCSDTSGCFIAKEDNCYFISPENFNHYVKTLIDVANPQGVIKWHKFLINQTFE